MGGAGAIGAFAIALFGYLRNVSRDLKAETGKVDDMVDKTRTELVSDSNTSGVHIDVFVSRSAIKGAKISSVRMN